MPYAGISNLDLPQYIMSGKRLPLPQWCPDIVYNFYCLRQFHIRMLQI